jgi:hypothetical protein
METWEQMDGVRRSNSTTTLHAVVIPLPAQGHRVAAGQASWLHLDSASLSSTPHTESGW